MGGTSACKGVVFPIVRHADMSHFRVHQSMDDTTSYDRATPNARAHGDIETIFNVARSAPLGFSKSCGIHIRIESQGNGERLCYRPDNIVIAPFGLWCRGNVPVRS